MDGPAGPEAQHPVAEGHQDALQQRVLAGEGPGGGLRLVAREAPRNGRCCGPGGPATCRAGGDFDVGVPADPPDFAGLLVGPDEGMLPGNGDADRGGDGAPVPAERREQHRLLAGEAGEQRVGRRVARGARVGHGVLLVRGWLLAVVGRSGHGPFSKPTTLRMPRS